MNTRHHPMSKIVAPARSNNVQRIVTHVAQRRPISQSTDSDIQYAYAVIQHEYAVQWVTLITIDICLCAALFYSM